MFTWPQETRFLYLFFNPSLQLVHFLVELLQTFSSAQGPLLIGSRLFQRLPLIPQLAELLPHQIRGGVCLADQLLAHLSEGENIDNERGENRMEKTNTGRRKSTCDTSRSDGRCLYVPVRLTNVGSLPFISWILRTPVLPLPFLGCLSVRGG